MVGQRKLLRLRACRGCGHLRGSHYVSTGGGSRHRHPTSRPWNSEPMTCHVVQCGCARFFDSPPDLPCPVCSRIYLTRTSLEVHLSKVHSGLAPRERSNLLAATLNMVV
jgi:hypothetical protein